MKHSISINGENIPVELFGSVFDRETNEVVDEGFDTIREAYRDYPRSLFRCEWTAARILDKDGNLDFPIYCGSNIRKAISILKDVLS